MQCRIRNIKEKERRREFAKRGSAVISCKIKASVVAFFVDDFANGASLTNQCKSFVPDRKC
jgi:hypothetical protein